MIDIEQFIRSLKCTWLRRLLKTNGNITALFTTFFGKDSLYRIFDLGDDYISLLLGKSNNKFWIDSLNAWKVLRLKTQSVGNILNTPLWYNSRITMDGKSMHLMV